MKRSLSLILVFALLLTLAVPAQAAGTINVTLSADKETVAPGETVTLTLSIDQTISNMFCFEYWIYYNADLLELTGTTAGEATSFTDFGVPKSDKNGTYFQVLALNKEGDPWTLNAGTIATITFTAKADASGDAAFNLVQEVGLVDYDTYEETPANLVNNAANVTVKAAEPEVPADPNTVTLEGEISSIVFSGVTVKENEVTDNGSNVTIDVTLDAATAKDANVGIAITNTATLVFGQVEEGTYETLGWWGIATAGVQNENTSLNRGWGGYAFMTTNETTGDEMVYYINFVVDGIDLNCSHTWVKNTCTAHGYCSECGKPGDAAHGHNFVDCICTYCGAADLPFTLSVGEIISASAGEECDEWRVDSIDIKVKVPADTETLTITPGEEIDFLGYNVYAGMNDYHTKELLYSNPEALNIDLTKYNQICVNTYYYNSDWEYVETQHHLTIEFAEPEVPADPNTVILEGNAEIGSIVFSNVTVKESKVTANSSEVVIDVTLDETTDKDATVNVAVNTVAGFLVVAPEEAPGYSTFNNTYYTGPGACNGSAALTNGKGGFLFKAGAMGADDFFYRINFTVAGSDEPDAPAAAGYRFATSADVSAENGGTAVVKVKITGHSDPNVTSYNAYDLTLTFDSDKLELATDENGNYIYSGAVKTDGGSVTVSGNTIRIVGCGAAKEFGTEIAALTFKTKAEGTANVTISKVQVSDKEESVKENAPEATPKHDEDDTTADETPDVSVVIVPYSVTKPDFVSGNDKILHGETYTFSYTDTTNYTYSGLKVTVGGTEVTPTEADGVYTVANVTGAVVIEVTRNANSYDVEKPDTVTGPDQATYGEDYIFTVTPPEGKEVDTVTVTTPDGTKIGYEINENGEYVIKGTDIPGGFTINVTEKDKAPTETTITFTGIEESEIEGGLTQTAEIGKDFTFKLNKVEGFDYTVMVGETELTESEETEGQYTIPAELVVKGGVAVTIEKVDNTKPVVDVAEYISLDGKVMFLVTAKWGDRVLAYGEDTMYWSDKYTVTGEEEAGAYCWLVLSTDEMNTIDLVKAAAEAAIVEAAEGATATNVKYNYDINGTTKVDVNDAQLAYDMYNASYMEFSDNLPMLKFLEADMETDGKLDTKDVAAIINYIVSGANA